jgi:hypothetical protein
LLPNLEKRKKRARRFFEPISSRKPTKRIIPRSRENTGLHGSVHSLRLFFQAHGYGLIAAHRFNECSCRFIHNQPIIRKYRIYKNSIVVKCNYFVLEIKHHHGLH